MTTKMHDKMVGDVLVKTNIIEGPYQSYPMGNGNDKKTYRMAFRYKGESDRDALTRLVRSGFRTVRFEYSSTMIRGIYDTIIYVK